MAATCVASRLAVVTGGAKGIGRSLCLAFAENGFQVVCADSDVANGVDLEHEAAGKIKFLEVDFSTPDSYRSLVEQAQLHFGIAHLSVLVNNVGIQTDNGKPVHLLNEETWRSVLAVNLDSYFLMAKQALLGSMLDSGHGVIINIASVQGHQSQVGIPAYAASKGAVLSLTRQMAMDYSSQGIRVVSVSPGTIRTPLVERLVTEDGQTCEELGARSPLGRMGHPEDIAELCLFLASDKAQNITGADFLCDGGIMSMGGWDNRVGFPSMGSK